MRNGQFAERMKKYSIKHRKTAFWSPWFPWSSKWNLEAVLPLSFMSYPYSCQCIPPLHSLSEWVSAACNGKRLDWPTLSLICWRIRPPHYTGVIPSTAVLFMMLACVSCLPSSFGSVFTCIHKIFCLSSIPKNDVLFNLYCLQSLTLKWGKRSPFSLD